MRKTKNERPRFFNKTGTILGTVREFDGLELQGDRGRGASTSFVRWCHRIRFEEV